MYAGGVLARDPAVVANGAGLINVAGVVPGGAVWYRPYTEGSSNDWQNWVWWYRAQLGQWQYVFQNSTVGGDLVGAPK